jgi:hypothetical protein
VAEINVFNLPERIKIELPKTAPRLVTFALVRELETQVF